MGWEYTCSCQKTVAFFVSLPPWVIPCGWIAGMVWWPAHDIPVCPEWCVRAGLNWGLYWMYLKVCLTMFGVIDRVHDVSEVKIELRWDLFLLSWDICLLESAVSVLFFGLFCWSCIPPTNAEPLLWTIPRSSLRDDLLFSSFFHEASIHVCDDWGRDAYIQFGYFLKTS